MEDLNFQMKIDTGLDKIRSGGGGGMSSHYYKSQNKNLNPKLTHFRQGEILQGKILKIKSDGLGLVRLPSGDFLCQLHDGLMAGDEMFFKITEVDPSLVLKVHAVQSYLRSVKRRKEDIVRILDLPKHELYYFTADIFLTYKNLIYKDDVLKFFKFYTSVPKIELYDTESAARTLFWLAESELPFDNDTFYNSYIFFEGIKNIEGFMNRLFNDFYPVLADNVKNILSPYRKAYFGTQEENKVFFDFFSKEKSDSNLSFYNLITKISQSKLAESMEDIPVEISEFITAMHYWNSVCTGSEAAYHWSFPVRFNNKTHLVTLVLRSQFNIKKILLDALNAEDFEQQDIDVGEVVSQINERHQSSIANELSSVRKMEDFLNLIGKYMEQDGLTLLAIQYYDGKLITVEAPAGATLSSNRSISFVV